MCSFLGRWIWLLSFWGGRVPLSLPEFLGFGHFSGLDLFSGNIIVWEPFSAIHSGSDILEPPSFKVLVFRIPGGKIDTRPWHGHI